MSRPERLALLKARWAVVRLFKEHKPAPLAAGLFLGPLKEPKARKRKPRSKHVEKPHPWKSSVHGICLHEAHRRKLWVSREDEQRNQPWQPRAKRNRGEETALTKIAKKLKRGSFYWRVDDTRSPRGGE